MVDEGEVVKHVGTAVVDAAVKAGGYFARILGTVPEDLVGVAGGDWLRHKRMQNWIELESRTRSVISSHGFDGHWKPISPKFFIEWSESASLESDSSLQQIWANLMAATIDPGQNFNEEPFLIDALKRLDPAGARTVKLISSMSFHGKDVLDPYVAVFSPVTITEGLTAPSILQGGGYTLEKLPRVSLGDIVGHYVTLQKLDVLGLIAGTDKVPTILSLGGTGQPDRELFTIVPTWLGQLLHKVLKY